MLDSDEAIPELIIEILDISSFRTAVNSTVVLMFELLVVELLEFRGFNKKF